MARRSPAIRRTPPLTTTAATPGCARATLAAARADFDQALALRPGYDLALDNRARVRLELGDDAGAADDLTAVLAQRPDDLAARSAGPSPMRRRATTTARSPTPRRRCGARRIGRGAGRARLGAGAGRTELDAALADCDAPSR